jgi:hypothetical protein
MSSTAAGHAGENPWTSNNVGSEKGKIKNPCWLCKDMHHTYLFPHLDEASYLLKKIVKIQSQPPTTSSNLPLVDELVNLVPSLVSVVDQVVFLSDLVVFHAR